MILEYVQDCANGAAILFSLAAACLWFWASAIKIPPFPDVGFDSGGWVFEPVRAAMSKSAKRNALAALFSGLASIAAFVSLAGHATQERAGISGNDQTQDGAGIPNLTPLGGHSSDHK